LSWFVRSFSHGTSRGSAYIRRVTQQACDGHLQVFHAWAQFDKAAYNSLDFTLLMARGPDGLPALELHATDYGTEGTLSRPDGLSKLDSLTQSLPTISKSTSQVPHPLPSPSPTFFNSRRSFLFFVLLFFILLSCLLNSQWSIGSGHHSVLTNWQRVLINWPAIK
jgi:hypothetical protein